MSLHSAPPSPSMNEDPESSIFGNGKAPRRSSGMDLDNHTTTGIENYILDPQAEDDWRQLLVDSGDRSQNTCWEHFKKYKNTERGEYVVCLICLSKELNNAKNEGRDLIPKKFEVKYGSAKSTSKLTSHDERKHPKGLDGEPITKKRKVTEKKEKVPREPREPGIPKVKVRFLL